ncbi:right-handed parallel beta-helix repeat-containing protein [Anaeromyxobacter oryzae]|uniref:Right handed beta helix domain-containing protein n=1 Tax=Anaeromyxobacter oryzae TaxID=2918170 RepID=A0ABN6MY11_9BACT|nr:right-handed parallel beta-helix repeat-containing protein [Anaeromyxobacter oryzae]BDG04623.1 hypothetical protein AMOR_36190 [Anaeromyxobacter oryzae]
MIVRRSFAPIVAVVALLLACGGSGPGSEDVLGLMPPPGIVAQAALDVVWSIQEASGCGSITSAGVYTAPTAPATSACHIVARVANDTTASSVATVTIAAAQTPPPAPPPPAGTSGDAISRCASDPIRSTGTVYYVCSCDSGAQAGCAAGDDANPGTSPSAPKRTFSAAQAQFRGMNAGDTVALCKGGSWVNVASTSPHWVNSRCNATSTCDLRAYDPPGTSGRARPYVDITSTAMDFWNASGGTKGYRFQGISWHGRSGAYGFYTATRNLSDVMLCDNRFDGFNVAVGPMIDRLYVVSNQIVNSATQGFIGGSNYGRIENNTFDNNGTAVGHHSIYLGAGITDGGTNLTIRGNHSTRSSQSNGRCIGTHIVAHGQFQNLLIEGNTIEESGTSADPGCWGIGILRDSEVPSGSIPPEYFRNVTIRGNTIRNVGNALIALGQCESCVVENNLLMPGPTMGGTAVYGTPNNYAPQTGTNGSDADTTNLVVRNNTIYSTGGQASGISFERAGGGGHEIYNNAVYVVGGSCIPQTAGVTYNAFNTCTTAATSSWFVSAGSDFTPAAGSPLVNAGTTRGGATPTIDFLGTPRDSTPDIGAFERH